MSFKKLSIIISFENFNEDVKNLIKEIRPDWNVNKLKIMRMQGGISNFLSGVYSDDNFKEGETDMVLVRVYGKMLLDRESELRNMSALAINNLSAKVWAQFENGCCYQFIHGNVLDELSVRDPRISTLIIEEFVKLHSSKPELGRPIEPFLFNKIKEMASEIPSGLDDAEKNLRLLREFPTKLQVFEEINELEVVLVGLKCPVTFCHNDLLIKNIVMNPSNDRIHMIDFEYSDYNYCAFDIANHFNEFAGLDSVDYSLYPDETFQKQWLLQYLTALYHTKNGVTTSNGDIPVVDDAEVDHWYRMVNKFALASHLFWSIWAIFQEMNSLIDFDYLGYALIRWNEYKRRKEEFLSL